MANDAAWSEGWAQGREATQHRRDRKEMLTDEQHAIKRDDLIKTKDSLTAQLANYKDANGNLIPEMKDQHDQTMAALAQNQYDFGQLYDPIKNPGKLQSDWHYLRERIHGIRQPKNQTPSSVTSQAPEVTVNTPAALTQSLDLPAAQQTTPALPSKGGNVTTTQPGAEAVTMPTMGGSVTLPAPPPVTVTKAPTPAAPSRGQAQVMKQKAASMQKAQQEAALLASGTPLSPQQQAVMSANVTNAGSLAAIQGQIKNYKTLNPNATEEDVAAYASTLLPGNNQIGNWERVDGTIDGQPYALSYDKKRGVYKSPDGTISSNMPENFKPAPKSSGATAQELSDYAADNDPKKGPFVQWLSAKRTQGTASSKPKSKDDRFIEINQKKLSGQPVTPDDQAFLGAYDLWTQKTKIDPGVARAAAFGAMRYIPVVDNSDPSNPGNVVMMRAGDAANAKVSTPASIAFKTDQAITRYMTSGAGGTNINYFNTATDHLKLLAEAGEALNNGNTQLFNNWANRFATATGNPAPTNFETVKAAVAGELSKTFKGTGATDSEISEINQTINQAESPDQIRGAIDYYKRLMGSKLQALKSQYDAAKEGKPNFPGTESSPNNGGKGVSKGSRSLAAAMALPINKGKSAEEVQKHLESLGYTVVKP